MPILKQVQAVTLSSCLALMTSAAAAEPQNTQGGQSPAPAASHAQPTAKELQSLVEPIALYPDKLVAQIVAAATHPAQIVEAQRWLEEHKSLTGQQLGNAVDKQSWDPSVKGLTQFPSVLDNMSQNLSWTSALGDAYHSYPHDVMAAIQTMRQTAENSGNLKTTSQQTVANQGGTIVIEPANPQVVYVPTYSPAVYGAYAPPPYPGYSGWDMAAASAISFGAGMAVGAAWDHAWGWNSWGTSWHGGNVTYNHNTYISNTNNFRNQYNQFRGADSYNRSSFQGQTGEFNRASNFSGASSSHNWQSAESRGYFSGDKPSSGLNSGSFSDFRDGGFAHDDSFRGQSSFGGFDRSGGFGGGGFDRGGFGGGGFRGGGRR